MPVIVHVAAPENKRLGKIKFFRSPEPRCLGSKRHLIFRAVSFQQLFRDPLQPSCLQIDKRKPRIRPEKLLSVIPGHKEVTGHSSCTGSPAHPCPDMKLLSLCRAFFNSNSPVCQYPCNIPVHQLVMCSYGMVVGRILNDLQHGLKIEPAGAVVVSDPWFISVRTKHTILFPAFLLV